MVPNYFIEMDSLPYTPNGKIDRKKLPEPEYEKNKEKIILPSTQLEIKLISLIKEILKIDTISMDDSFFELGGDSLLAINL